MNAINRREFIAASAAALLGAVVFCSASSYAAETTGKKTFIILHANDLHSAFLGLGPATDYTPFRLNDDETRGGYARQAAGREIKEWQAIMGHLRRLPAKKGELPVIPVDERANEVRAIKAG